MLPVLKSVLRPNWPRRVSRWFLDQPLLQQFVIAATFVVGFAVIAVGSWVSARITNGVLRSSATPAALYMQSFIESHVQSLANTDALPDRAIAALDALSARLARQQHVLSIKIWTRDGRLAYSRDRSLIGRDFGTAEIHKALSGLITASIASLNKADNALERKISIPLFEIYAPLYEMGTSRIIGVAEFYENATAASGEVNNSILTSWVTVGAAAIAMFFILFLIVHRGSTVIETQKRALEQQLARHTSLHDHNEALRKRVHHALRQLARIDKTAQQRIGMALHDGPAQLLAFVLLRLDELHEHFAAPHSHHAQSTDSSRLLGQIRDATADALGEIRAISRGLVHQALGRNNDLIAALRVAIHNHERHTDTKVRFEVRNIAEEPPAEITACLVSVASEALSNAYKHAGGVGQSVAITVNSAQAILSVRDAGAGISSADPIDFERSNTLGLPSMKYKAESLGGTLTLNSTPARGTEVRCSIPLFRQISSL